MKAILLPFLAAESLSALPTAPRTVAKKVTTPTLFTRFRSLTGHAVTGSPSPSRQEHLVLLALACLYPVLALVGCWLLLEVVQHFLTVYFSQIDSVTLYGVR